uniref:peptidylprolyl isomerase n=1 Tax=Nyssomyia neivai TaxID=330878 RepID=A0A1L8DXC3_9DIPT
MVFGLVLTPNKKYSQTVEKDYQVSNAALDTKTCGTGDTQLMVTVDKNSFILCTLNKKEPQYSFDLQIAVGEKIAFCSVGDGTIHLTGYMMPDDPTMEDFDDGSESDEEGEDIDVPELVPIEGKLSKKQQKKAAEASQEDSDDDDDDDDDLDDTFGDEEESEDDDDDDDDDEDEDDDEEEDEEEDVPQPAKKSKLDVKENGLENGVPQKSKKELKKERKQEAQQKQKDGKDEKKPQQQKGGKKQVLQGGVMIDDLTVGSGPEASQTKKVVVYYEGRLNSNNKVFDSCKKGSGFKFTLGRGEVIRGWDIGVAGMKVGSKRRITVPPNMAYGAKGSPPVIPPNSTLVFDVELRHVK